MCGIAGIVDFAHGTDPDVLERMCRAMEHRGPDSRGIHLDGPVGLGAQRLAIIDVNGGDQPVLNEDGSIAVVLNGEIYNHRELRDDLIARGHTFSSHVDTEVIAHLYEEHGAGLVSHLRGMFAFAVWDRSRRRLVLARDRAGKKPLFWARHGGTFWFASELRALLEGVTLRREVDMRAVEAYLALQYVPHPLSIFKGVHKLPPASTLVLDETGEAVDRYWHLDYSTQLTGTPIQDLEEQLRTLLNEATRLRLMSEVPLGALLSGGVDSSAVVASMAAQMSEPVKTFSIGFEDRTHDETEHARLVAREFATDHHEFQVEPSALSIMPKLARHYGEPFGDPSAIPSFYLAELTSRELTVALNGDGGDESFAGYRRYVQNRLIGKLDWIPGAARRAAPAMANVVARGGLEGSIRNRARLGARALAMDPSQLYVESMSVFNSERRTRLLAPDFAGGNGVSDAENAIRGPWAALRNADPVDRMLGVDVESYLPGDLLVKMDIATMAHSMEARSPFLDHHLMEFAAALPAEVKLRGGEGKHILKSALRGILPDQILDRPKMGFGVPLARWFREDLVELPREVLLDPATVARGYFQRSEVERLISEHEGRIADHSHRIWVLLQLEMWHREVLEAPTLASVR